MQAVTRRTFLVKSGQDRPGHALRGPAAGLPALPEAQPGLPRRVHLGPGDLPADLRHGRDLRDARDRVRRPGHRRCSPWSASRSCCSRSTSSWPWSRWSASRSCSWLTNWFRKESAKTYRVTREKVALVIVHFVESMLGIRAVQAFRREPRNQEIFDDVNEQYRAANLRAFRLVAWFMPGIKLIGNITISVVLLYGAYLAFHGEVTVGVLAAFLLYLRQFFEPMQEISQFYNTFQSASAALEKLSGVLEEEPSVPEPVSPTPARRRARRRAVRAASASSTSRARRCCPASTSTSPRGRRWPWSAPPAPARPRSPSCCPGSTTPPPGGCTLDGVDLRDLDEQTLRKAGRDGDPGELHVRRHGRRQHPVRPARGEHGAGGRGAPQAIGAHEFITRLPAGLRHRRRQQGRPAVGRPAPARRVRAGVPRRPRRAHPRRGDVARSTYPPSGWCSGRCARSWPTGRR